MNGSATMDHESVLDVIDADNDDYTDYENSYEDDVEDGQLRSGLQAMDIGEADDEREDSSACRSPHEMHPGENIEGEVRNADENGAVQVASGTEFRTGRGGPTMTQKSRRRKRTKPVKAIIRGMSIDRFVVETCRRLGETKFPLFREAVDRIGIDGIQAIVDEVDVIEKCGGQLTANGARRRSPGGVLWNILRDHVGPVVYKDIMKEGNKKYQERQRNKQRERGPGKRELAQADEQQNSKRRKVDSDVHMQGTTTYTSRPPRPPRELAPEGLSSGLQGQGDNLRIPVEVQNAWIRGLKMHVGDESPMKEDRSGSKPATEKDLALLPKIDRKLRVSERIRMTISYDDLVEEGEVPCSLPVVCQPFLLGASSEEGINYNGMQSIEEQGALGAAVMDRTKPVTESSRILEEQEVGISSYRGLDLLKEDGEIDDEVEPCNL